MEVIIEGVKYAPVIEKPDDKSLLSALELRFDSDAGTDITVREYMCILLTKVWEEEERFSGKRPFGNSGWRHDLQAALLTHGFLEAPVAGEPYVAFDIYVEDLVKACFYGVA